MIVDHHAERGPVVEQVMARAAPRHDEGQNLTIDLALTREFGGGARRLVQDLRRLARSVPNQTHSASGKPMISP